MRAHVAFDKDGLGEAAPRPAQIDGVDAFGGGEFAVKKDKAVWPALRRACGGDVGVGFAVDRAVFKQRGRAAKDEVGRAFDGAVFVALAAVGAVGVERILIAEHAAVFKLAAIGLRRDRDRLANGPGGVFDDQVDRPEVVALDKQGRGVEGAVGAAFDLVEIIVPGDRHLAGGLGLEGQSAVPGMNSDLFLVHAGCDRDGDPLIGKRFGVVDRLLDGREVAAAIEGNADFGLVLSGGSSAARLQKKQTCH